MNRFLLVTFILVLNLILFQACTGIKSEPKTVLTEPEERGMDDSTALYLDKFSADFEEGLANQKIPGGAVVIVKEGQVIFNKGFGLRETGKSDNVDEHTVFRIGSVSKGFASVLTGILAEEELLSWDGSISGYLEDFKLFDPEQTDRVQVKHILSHTSGLPRHAYTNLVEDGLSLERIIPRLERVPLIAKEGEQLAYQNAAYSVIEKVMEAQTGTDFDSLLRQKIFEPLGMENSSANYDSLIHSENKAVPHVWYSRSRGRVPVKITKKYYNAISSGGINASASDIGKWLLLLTGYNPEVISNETLNEIYEPLATINNKRFSRYWDNVNESHYGMGWRVLDNKGQKIVYHGGYVNGYRTEIAFDPDNGIGICILINANSSYPLQVIPGLFDHFRAEYSNSTSD